MALAAIAMLFSKWVGSRKSKKFSGAAVERGPWLQS